jgi:polar amino acid transport system permease protein
VEVRGMEASSQVKSGTGLHTVPVKHYGRWLLAAVVLTLLGLIVMAFARANIDYEVIPEYMFSPTILNGVVNTIKLTIMCMIIGIVLGVTFAVMRQSDNPVLRTIAFVYLWFFRATPVLVQMLVWFNLSLVFRTVNIPGIYSADMNDVMTPLAAVLLGLGINEGSYMSEIVRGGLLSVKKGQSEAAQALGLTKLTTVRRIVLPQALRVIIPPTGNEVINMLKYTSLAYVISYDELLSSAFRVYSTNLQVIELLFVASLWYLMISSVLMVGQHFLEKRFARGLAPLRVRSRTFGMKRGLA